MIGGWRSPGPTHLYTSQTHLWAQKRKWGGKVIREAGRPAEKGRGRRTERRRRRVGSQLPLVLNPIPEPGDWNRRRSRSGREISGRVADAEQRWGSPRSELAWLFHFQSNWWHVRWSGWDSSWDNSDSSWLLLIIVLLAVQSMFCLLCTRLPVGYVPVESLWLCRCWV